MAKSRKSRRARKRDIAQQITPVPETPPEPEAVQPSVRRSRKSEIDFAEHYYYVYTELRNVIIIATVMFAITFGLGYFI